LPHYYPIAVKLLVTVQPQHEFSHGDLQ
jgi:hypothetical protein